MKKIICLASLAVMTASVWGMPFDNSGTQRQNNNQIQMNELSDELKARHKELREVINKKNPEIVELIRQEHGGDLIEKMKKGWNLCEGIKQKRYDLIRGSVKDLSKKDCALIINYLNGKVIFDAIELGDSDIFRYLIKLGADFNIQDGDGNTLMMIADKKQKPEIVDILYSEMQKRKEEINKEIRQLQQQIQRNEKEKQKCERNLKKESQILEQGKEKFIQQVSQKFSNGMDDVLIEVFFEGIEENNIYKAIFCYRCIEQLPYVTVDSKKLRNKEGDTPVAVCIKCGNIEILEWLIKEKANLNNIDRFGNSALILAMTKGKEDIVKLLLSYFSEDERTNAMFFAIENRLWNMAEIALNSGVDVTKKNGSIPPLISALKTIERDKEKRVQQLAFVKKLINTEGVKYDAEDENGFKAISYAVYNKCWEITELLRNNSVKTSFKLIGEIEDYDWDQIVQLNLKPYKEKIGQNEKKIKPDQTNQQQKSYELWYANTGFKDYKNNKLDGRVTNGIDEVIKYLATDPLGIANESLTGKCWVAKFVDERGKDHGYVRIYSTKSGKSNNKGRVAYVVIEDLKRVLIVEASGEHYNFMKKYKSLRDIFNECKFKPWTPEMENFEEENSQYSLSIEKTAVEETSESNEESYQSEDKTEVVSDEMLPLLGESEIVEVNGRNKRSSISIGMLPYFNPEERDFDNIGRRWSISNDTLSFLENNIK